jgi:hypothetical protein
LGWTRLLAHGVPIADNDDIVFGPDALLMEVRTLLGLKKAYFAMPPRWLKPIEQLPACYSTITFAISDPDGSYMNTLIKGHPALFDKEVKIQKSTPTMEVNKDSPSRPQQDAAADPFQ